MFMIPTISYAQKDVTTFLDIPVDGYKPEVIKKLISKGFTINKRSEDVLDGEFNGRDVHVFVATNNNKVWRIQVSDVNLTDATNIKIRFNNLIQQFANNTRYSKEPDSILVKYTIPKGEDISYEMKVKNKRYQAIFYQKSLKHDSLMHELSNVYTKEISSDDETEKAKNLLSEIYEETINSLNRRVWFMIEEENGKYSIIIFYENIYNESNGEEL